MPVDAGLVPSVCRSPAGDWGSMAKLKIWLKVTAVHEHGRPPSRFAPSWSLYDASGPNVTFREVPWHQLKHDRSAIDVASLLINAATCMLFVSERARWQHLPARALGRLRWWPWWAHANGGQMWQGHCIREVKATPKTLAGHTACSSLRKNIAYGGHCEGPSGTRVGLYAGAASKASLLSTTSRWYKSIVNEQPSYPGRKQESQHDVLGCTTWIKWIWMGRGSWTSGDCE